MRVELIIQDIPSSVNLISAAKLLGIKYTLYKVIPFSNDTLPKYLPTTQRSIVFGGKTLQDIVENDNNNIIFRNDNFSYKKMLSELSEHCLNADAVIDEFKNLFISETSFIRPNNDSKIFVGHLISPSELIQWQKAVNEIPENEFTTLRNNTLTCVSSIKNVTEEYRIFIIGNKISSFCRYAKYGKLNTAKNVPMEALDFARSIIDKWLPHSCCVMDIACINNEYKIIEFNCLNDSGFYEVDIVKILNDLNKIYGE